MNNKYILRKEIKHPFGNHKVGEVHTVHEWLDIFGVDWLAESEQAIYNNFEWFQKKD